LTLHEWAESADGQAKKMLRLPPRLRQPGRGVALWQHLFGKPFRQLLWLPLIPIYRPTLAGKQNGILSGQTADGKDDKILAKLTRDVI
jgi:hypothetical protein